MSEGQAARRSAVQPVVLVVDDEPDLLELVSLTLSRMNLRTRTAADLESARKLLRSERFDLCLTDMRLPDGDGLDLVGWIQENRASLPVAVITAHGNVELAVRALKLGAFDFVSKPLDLGVLRKLVGSAIKLGTPPGEETVATLRGPRLLGSSQVMEQLREMIARVARSQAPVHIWGESGTGKELVAEAIHDYSPRKNKPFVVVNCAALPENLLETELFGHERGAFTGAVSRKAGRFEQADTGTIFLDEIGELSPNLQSKLLRVLQEHAFQRVGGTETIQGDFRVIAATNRDLQASVREKVFREDLFYRLNVVRIPLPPLRERRSDIVPLAEHFLRLYSEKNGVSAVGFSDEAILLLQNYFYPGNVRELENMVERAVLMARGRVLMPEHFPERAEIHGRNSLERLEIDLLSLPFHAAIGELEKRLIEKAIKEAGGNKSEAANRLQINRRLLYNKISEHKIDAP